MPDSRHMAAVRALWGWIYDRPYLLLALTTLMWGGNAVASRLAVGHISPMALTWLRWLVVCLLIAPCFAKDVIAQAPSLIARRFYIVLMAMLGYVAFNALMYAAAHHTPAINLTILQGSIPVLVLVGGLVWFGTRIRLMQVIGVAVTLVGVAVVAARGDVVALAALSFNIGDLWMIAACAAYAVYVGTAPYSTRCLGLRVRRRLIRIGVHPHNPTAYLGDRDGDRPMARQQWHRHRAVCCDVPLSRVAAPLHTRRRADRRQPSRPIREPRPRLWRNFSGGGLGGTVPLIPWRRIGACALWDSSGGKKPCLSRAVKSWNNGAAAA